MPTARIVLAAALSVLLAGAAPAPSAPPAAGEIRVTLIGTGTPVPSVTQFGPATLVEAGGRVLLFDCGRGCGIRLGEVRPGLMAKVTDLFLTHLHSDHVVGIPDLWLNGWLQNRAAGIRVAGPAGTMALMAGLRAAYTWDIELRSKIEKVPATTAGLDGAVTDIPAAGGVVYDDDGVRITAFPVDHGKARPSFGYRIDHAGHSVVISGDTRYSAELVRQAMGSDLLVHELIAPGVIRYLEKTFTPGQVADVVGNHTTVEDAARIFSAARPRLALYTHFVRTPDSDRQVEDATRRGYSGAFALGEDLMSVLISDDIRFCDPEQHCVSVRSK